MQPLAEAGAELFQEEAPNVQITVGGAGTGDGFERFCRGETVIADASRAIEAEEIEACQAKNIAPVEIQVGIDGLSVVANKDLEIPNNCITTDQLKELLEPKSKVKNYSELGDGFPDQAVSFFTPGTESGTYDYFTDEVLETDAEQRTQDVQTSADDNQIITGISGTEGALGYVGFAFADENKDKLKILAVDGGDGCVAPSLQTIRDGTLHAALAPAVHVSEREDGRRSPRSRASSPSSSTNNQQVTEASDYVAADRRAEDEVAAGARRRQDQRRGPDLGGRGMEGSQFAVSRPGAGPGPRLERTRTRRSVGEQGIKVLLAAAALLSVLTTTGIVVTLLVETIDFFRQVPFGDFFFDTDWAPLAGGEQQSFGVVPLIWSTLYLTIIGLIVAVPLGLGVGIYLAEYASPARAPDPQADHRGPRGDPDDRLRLLRADLLHADDPAGHPRHRRRRSSTACRPASSSASSCCRRSRRSARTRCRPCPQSLREGAFGLGAAKWQVVAARRLPGRAVGHRRRARARRLARHRRDRRDPRRRRQQPEPDASTSRWPIRTWPPSSRTPRAPTCRRAASPT